MTAEPRARSINIVSAHQTARPSGRGDPGLAAKTGFPRPQERTGKRFALNPPQSFRDGPTRPVSRSINGRRSLTLISFGAFQPLQRFEDFLAAAFGLFALLALAVDDLLRRVRHEAGIAELGVDALDVGFGLLQFLVQPHALGVEIDHALERQRGDL